MSLIQRFMGLLDTLQYYTGTQNGVLVIEIPSIWGFVVERF